MSHTPRHPTARGPGHLILPPPPKVSQKGSNCSPLLDPPRVGGSHGGTVTLWGLEVPSQQVLRNLGWWGAWKLTHAWGGGCCGREGGAGKEGGSPWSLLVGSGPVEPGWLVV